MQQSCNAHYTSQCAKVRTRYVRIVVCIVPGLIGQIYNVINFLMRYSTYTYGTSRIRITWYMLLF